MALGALTETQHFSKSEAIFFNQANAVVTEESQSATKERNRRW